jgi:NADH-quinone oxidoreductase subunit L
MAGEQDMVKMGALKKYMPVTYATMMIGTLAIAGIPPFSGFFSKDEILWRAFQGNTFVWGIAVLTALMTAFYMFRLMSLTFFGDYRGRPFEAAHGPAPAPAGGGHDDAHGGHGGAGHAAAGHGEGEWHGPHESPRPMTFALVTLAIGAVLAGFVGVPAALGGNNAIETFLHPSFTAHASAVAGGERAAAPADHGVPAVTEHAAAAEASAPQGEGGGAHESALLEWALMAFSVLIGLTGILVAYRFYVRRPEISARLAERFAGPHAVLYHKYYVDEFYDATVIRGTMGSANGLWTFDRTVVDGAVNGSGWLTIFSSWLSHLADKYIVDGLVNLVGSLLQESSFVFRRFQTGLIQNYALLMLFGVFALVSLYLLRPW